MARRILLVQRYTSAAVVLHWLTAALICGSFALGLSMVDLPLSPHKLRVYSWHKWIGITIFLTAFARIIWRAGHPAPALPASVAEWQQRAAVSLHILLYVLLLVIPVSGWLYSSAAGVPVVYLGLIPLPDLVPPDKALAAQLKLVHKTLTFAMGGLLLLHIAAALKHHLIDGDEVLVRMLPFLKPRLKTLA